MKTLQGANPQNLESFDADYEALEQGHSQESDFLDFYKRHLSTVRSIAYRLGVKEGELEDVSQEVFIKAWNNKSSFKGLSTEKTWIARITVNTAYDHFRRLKSFFRLKERKKTHDLEVLSYPSLKEFSAFENQQLLKKVVDSLSREETKLFALGLVEEFSMVEISQVLNIPEGSVKSKLYRLKNKIRISLEKLGVNHEF